MQSAIPQVTLPRRDGLAELVVPRLSMPPVIPAPQPRAPGRHLRTSGDDRGRLRPLAFLAVALAVAAAIGKLPRESDFGRYSGLPAIGVVPVAVIVVLITFGEETGWRGFALPLLQRRHGALAAALLITPIWAVWHLPYFFTVATYRDFAPVGHVGFVFGLACGSIVLTWRYNGTGGSILACAVWHGLYNLETGTAGATATIQAVTTAFIYVLTFLLVRFELRARKRGEASILGPRRGATSPSGLPGATPL